MTFDSFKNAAFEKALQLGCDAAEIYMRDSENLSVSVLEGDLDSYEFSRDAGANLRVQYDGRDGYCYTEVFDDPETVVRKALDNAKLSRRESCPINGECEYPEIPEPDDTADRLSSSDMIALALDTEKAVLAADKRLSRLAYNLAAKTHQTVYIGNTRGLNAFFDDSLFVTVVEPVAESDGETHDEDVFAVGRAALNPKATALSAAGLTLAKFGAAPVKSGDYRILLQGKAMTALLQAFAPQFCADVAQKGLSPLADKVGQTVASACVSITDDPLNPYAPRPFDAEGTPSRATQVVKNGRLCSLLHDLKTAQKAGCLSTSNAGRAGISSPISVECTNFILENGEKSLPELLSDMGDGLLICNLSGLHAGVDAVTGHFSLLASGFAVKDGKVSSPVERITVAGNFNTLLRDITALGDDPFFSIPGSSVFGSPSVYLEKGLKVSGT